MSKSVALFHCGMIYSGGGERIILGQMDELARRDYQVSCWVPVFDPQKCYPDIIHRYRIHTFLPQLPRWVPLRHALWMVLTSLLAPFLAFRFRHADIIIGENQPGIWIAFCISRVLGKNFLAYTCHPNRLVYPRKLTRRQLWKTQPDFYVLSLIFIPFFKPLLAFLDRISFRAAQNLLVNGYYIGREVENTYGVSWQGCPSGANLSKFFCQPPQSSLPRTLSQFKINSPYILYVGRHEVWKRIDLAIRALKIINQRLPQVELVVPGPQTNHTQDLIRLARDLQLDQATKFIGQVNQQQLGQLFAHAQVFVFPSTREDFGIVILEAMAAGTPVVAWNQGGPTDIVNHGRTGFLISPGDIDQFAAHVIRLLEDPRLRRQMAAAGRKKVARQFSWTNHGDILEKAILQLDR